MNVAFQQVDSISELRERLRKSPYPLLLGDDDEAPRHFYIGIISRCTLGVCSQGHGIKPSVLVDESREDFWIGFNSKVANVDLRSCRQRFVITLDCVFHAILGQMDDGSVIVVYELGACRVSRSGELLWNCSTGLVLDSVNAGRVLQIRTESGQFTIDKEHGAVLS